MTCLKTHPIIHWKFGSSIFWYFNHTVVILWYGKQIDQYNKRKKNMYENLNAIFVKCTGITNQFSNKKTVLYVATGKSIDKYRAEERNWEREKKNEWFGEWVNEWKAFEVLLFLWNPFILIYWLLRYLFIIVPISPPNITQHTANLSVYLHITFIVYAN